MESIWSATVKGAGEAHPVLRGERNTEVLIIGGGMAGILTAYRLKSAGVPCVVAEGKTVGSGITQNTTAKITAQHGLLYADLLRRSGIEAAKLYYQTNTRAIRSFKTLADEFPCDFEEKTAYVYAVKDQRKLEREAAAYIALGLRADILQALPLPLPLAGALAMERQAQFNPLKLLYALAKQVEVYENTFIHRVEGHTAFSKEGRITAKHIIYATHFPFVNIPGLYFMKLYQHRSYVLALERAAPVEGMFIDEREDGYSFRSYGRHLLVGGGDHKTGKPGGGYADLRRLVKDIYPEAVESYHWAAQDCMTLDGIPYIGRHRRGTNHVYVATGFQKWGMTASMAAAELLTDLIVAGKSETEAIYSPQRSLWTRQLFVNLGSAMAGLAGVGAPRCSHMGCKLHWNAAEASWDCACHGSRFNRAGDVMDNPAKRGIH